VLVEVALRVFSFGHETTFFLRRTIDGREMLIDNAKFGWRFFPPLIARTPEPFVLSRHKKPGTCRIFVLGESAAMGDPDPAVGLPRMLQAMLEVKFPQGKFEVVNVAMTAINSHVIRETAKDCAVLEGDFWIVYAGNNEIVGPFGGGTVLGPQVPPLSWIRFTIWFKGTRIGQLISNTRKSEHVEWEGMEMFLNQQVRHDDPRLPKVYANFRENLSDIIRLGTRSGARVIVSTVAVNLRDSPPFASQLSIRFDPETEQEWGRHWSNALAAQGAGEWNVAANALAAAERTARTNSQYAELHFQMGRVAEALGRKGEAHRAFNAAKEYDTLRFRADDAVNAIARSFSNPAVRLVDAEQALATVSSNGIPGAEFFYEHVHFTFEGNYTLVRLFFDEIVKQLPIETLRGARDGAPSRDDCAQRLCWNEWKQRGVFGEVRRRLQQPPFTAQLNHTARDEEWRRQIDGLSQQLTPQRMGEIGREYQRVLAHAKSDWVLHEDYAKLLTELGDNTNALAHWREVTRLLPHDATPFFYLGTAADALGLAVEAVAAFREAILRDPNMVEARSSLGLALAASGQIEAGKRELLSAVQIRPRFTQARVNLGTIFAREGKSSEAREQYEHVLRIEPENAAAHLNLGKLFSAAGDKVRAAHEYREALRMDPRSAVAHFNLGNVTAGEEAVHHYRTAVTLDPSFADAQLNLALELGKSNKTSEALPHFAQYVRLRPNDAEGRFNYGVALAKSRQFNEAVQEFRETLRLDPKNSRAREFLERIPR